MYPHADDNIPCVSVLMPVYNAERFLKSAVDSILSQSFSDFELVAINDGSTDSSLDILESYSDQRIRIISNTRNLGLITTLNNGLKEARAEYVARMDADDVSHPERLEKQVRYLDKNPNTVMVGSWGIYIDEAGCNLFPIQPPHHSKEMRKALFKFNCFIHPSVMFRKIPVLSAGGYNEKAQHAEDYDLWLRLSESFSLANIPEVLVSYRIHADQISLRKISRQRKIANVCRIWALSRRQGMGLTICSESIDFSSPTWWHKITGAENTVGSDFLHWSWIYRVAGNKKLARKLAFRAFIQSPLSLKARKSVYQELTDMLFTKQQINVFRWYKYRIKSIFKEG